MHFNKQHQENENTVTIDVISIKTNITRLPKEL
jgi:hypothetical protein